MSKLVVPAHLRKYAASQEELNKYDMPGGVLFPRVSVGNNRFTAINAEGEQTFLSIEELEFIILDVNPAFSKVFYANGYDPETPQAPTCYSDNGFSPDIRVSEPQSQFCHSCQKNVWGSAESKMTGKGVKACADAKKTAIYILSDKAEGVHQFRVPPASLKAWREYLAEIRNIPTGDATFKIAPHQVITRASWDSRKQNVLQFEMVDYLEEDTMKFVMEEKEKGDFFPWIGTDQQSQTQRQLGGMAHTPPSHQLAAPEKVIDVESEPVRTPRPTLVRNQELEEKQEQEAPARRAPARAKKEAPAPEPAPKVSAMDLARAKARARIAADAAAKNGASR